MVFTALIFWMRSAAVIIGVVSFLTPNSGPIFHFAFTSTEITTPITAPFADIPPSELRSGCFYFSHQRVLFFCFSLQINIYPEGARLSPSYFSLSYPESKSYEPRNNGKQHCRTNTRHRAFPLALQRCPIVYCLSFISFSPFLFFPFVCHCLLFWTRSVRSAKPEDST